MWSRNGGICAMKAVLVIASVLFGAAMLAGLVVSLD
jgi:hypothetical protein